MLRVLLSLVLAGATLPALSSELALSKSKGRFAESEFCFLQSDEAGTASVLCTSSLIQHKLDGRGRSLNDQVILGEDATGYRRNAAMSASGDWVVDNGGTEVLYFSEGDLVPTDPVSYILNVGFIEDSPVVVTMSGQTSWPDSESAGWIQLWNGDKWSTVLKEPEAVDPSDDNVFSAKMENGAVTVIAGENGRFWLASTYRYQLRQYSASGKLLTEILHRGGAADRSAQHLTEEEIAKFKADMLDGRKLGGKPPRVSFSSLTSQKMLFGATKDLDGQIYVIAQCNDKLCLDRYRTIENVVERRKISTALPSRLTMAFTTHGLLVGGVKSADDVYFASNEDLAVGWKILPDITVNGLEPQSE